MNINELLKGIDCKCGRRHDCAIGNVIIKENAIEELSKMLSDYKNILIVADRNTYAVCGEEVKRQCCELLENEYIFNDKGVLVPNESEIERLDAQVSEKTELIIGIGSGVIQDLCKYVSFKKKLPYYIVATAPSMDGYASVGAAMITDNMKVTYSAHIPAAIIGDVNILKNAPIDMIKSGYGDILGKYSCLNDWKLSALINGEYFCEYVYNLAYDMLNRTKDLGPKLLRREPEAVKTLMEALVGVGIAMAYVGTSRPASGSEHHLSHFFEVIGIMNTEPYFLHGIDVAYSLVVTERLRERIISMAAPSAKREFKRIGWEREIRRIYGSAAEGVIALQKKLGWHEKSMYDVYCEKWQEIINILSEVPSSKKLIEYLNSIELDMADFNKRYGEEKISNAINYAMDLKDRYSVLWLYNELV